MHVPSFGLVLKQNKYSRCFPQVLWIQIGIRT